jgi:hypothetical protein
MSPGRKNGFVAKMGIVVIAPENKPISTPFWMLNDFVLEFGLSVLKNLIECSCLGLPDSSSLLLQLVVIICHLLAFSLAPSTANCISNVSSSLPIAVSVRRQTADLDAITHLKTATL